jgi:hypothetical protein
MEAVMACDTAYINYDGVRYAVTAHVDEPEEIVYVVMVHFAPPIIVSDPYVESFTPAEVNTPLRIKALGAIESLYGIHPVLERNR